MGDCFLKVAELSLRIKKTVSTIRKDVHRRPGTIPPRTILPEDARALVWRESDVDAWFASLTTEQAPQVKRGPGRPPLHQQIADQKPHDATAANVVHHQGEKPKSKGGRPRKSEQIERG